MPLMHQVLFDKADWYEGCLERLALELGYGYIPPSVALLLRHMRADAPSRIALLAQQIGVTRRRISQIAAEGVKLGVLELIEDADDKRVLLVHLSPGGKQMADATVASMHRVEAELARRIGRSKLEALTDLLAMDWGPAAVPPGMTDRATSKGQASAPTTPPRQPVAAKTATRKTAVARKQA
jgi:DNA-binding MarR family transcriptional regulator